MKTRRINSSAPLPSEHRVDTTFLRAGDKPIEQREVLVVRQVAILAAELSNSGVSNPRPSRRLEKLNRSKRIKLRAAQGGGPRTAQAGRGVALPLYALQCRPGRRLRLAPPSKPRSPAPKSAPHEVALAPSPDARNVDGALALQEAHHLDDRILRRNRDQHMHVVWHQMPLLNSPLSLPGHFHGRIGPGACAPPIE